MCRRALGAEPWAARGPSDAFRRDLRSLLLSLDETDFCRSGEMATRYAAAYHCSLSEIGSNTDRSAMRLTMSTQPSGVLGLARTVRRSWHWDALLQQDTPPLA